jgi:hypothetical protein
MTAYLARRALDAFARLEGASGADVESVRLIQESSKSQVYRFVWKGERIIGKRCEVEAARIERMVYERVLPVLAYPSLKYYGHVEDDPESGWIFLADTGGLEYCASIEPHRIAAARWAAALHTAGTALRVAGLPDRTPRSYLARLHSARANILDAIATAPLAGPDMALLTSILTQFDSIEDRWSELSQACEAVPLTFVHGDLQPKNLHVSSNGTSVSVFAIDWEYSGWGSPVSDFAFLDETTYFAAIRDRWAVPSRNEFKRLATIGYLFHNIAGIEWASKSLPHDHAFEDLRWYVKAVPETIGNLSDFVSGGVPSNGYR